MTNSERKVRLSVALDILESIRKDLSNASPEEMSTEQRNMFHSAHLSLFNLERSLDANVVPTPIEYHVGNHLD